MSEVKPDKRIDLRRVFLGLQEQMIARLSTNREVIRQPGTKGDAAELEWLGMLSDYLPERYRADKAFVLDSDGRISDQIDVVIYDRQYSPFLFNQDNAKYVPAESVYAVFEAKQDLNARHIAYAGNKAGSVRRLKRTSVPIFHAGGKHEPKEPPRILAGILVLGSEWEPSFGESFTTALQKLSPEDRLDLGCVLKYGGFDVRHSEASEFQVEVSKSESALIFFFLRLLARLQEVGTVAALDFGEYGRVL